MSVYIARTILNDWPQIYYSQVHGWSLIKADSIISWFEAGGLAGGLLAGYLSDFMFKSNRWMTGLIFALATVRMYRAGARWYRIPLIPLPLFCSRLWASPYTGRICFLP
ncbi:transport protein [Salmonella bongori]|nr:transport protein [Salmonella bongori]